MSNARPDPAIVLYDQRVEPSLVTQIETIEMLCESGDQSGGVMQESRTHVSVPVLVFEKESYYNVPWPVSPCVYSVLW